MNRATKRDVRDNSRENVKDRSTVLPNLPNEDERTFGDNSVGEEEPGPHDDDGLPENARRRVPS